MAMTRHNGKSLRAKLRDLSQIRRVYCGTLSRGIISRAQNSSAFALYQIYSLYQMDLSADRRVKHPPIFDVIFDLRYGKWQIKLDFARARPSWRKISFAAAWWDFRNLSISRVSRGRRMVSIKRIASEEGKQSREFLWKKRKDGNGGKETETREGNKSEESRREFMLRTHGNLWAANWRDGFGIKVKRWETEMETRCERSGMYAAQLLGLIPG